MSEDTRPVGKVAGALWRHRRETGALILVAVAGGFVASTGLPGQVALAGVVVAALAVPQSRRWLLGWPRRWRTRRQLLAGLVAVMEAVRQDKRPPKLRSLRSTPVGETAVLICRPGQTAELLTNLAGILRSAGRCRNVLVDRDANDGGRIYVDIIRRDAFDAGQKIPWADLTTPDLSLWDPIHIGTDEPGQPVRLPLAYRGLVAGGVMDSGKSSLLTNIVAHAAMGPAHLVLIDPNEVQFGPWRERALAYVGQDPAAAIATVRALIGEMDRRLALLHSLPGVVRKIDRQVAEAHGLHPILFAIDELAYHTASAGNASQRQEFANLCRDVVSRGRAVMIIPVVATQRPTQDVVPRALVDLFPYQVAFRVRNPANSDVILGDTRAKLGFDASEISATTPGVAYLQAGVDLDGQPGKRRRAGQDRPRRIKCCWIPDEVVAELAGASLPYKPAIPPGWTLTTAPERVTEVAA